MKISYGEGTFEVILEGKELLPLAWNAVGVCVLRQITSCPAYYESVKAPYKVLPIGNPNLEEPLPPMAKKPKKVTKEWKRELVRALDAFEKYEVADVGSPKRFYFDMYHNHLRIAKALRSKNND